MTVVGTRPELIRLSLVFERIAQAGIEHRLVHTGQNYDPRLSDIFFEELGLPTPDMYLGIRTERVGQQIGEIISAVGGGAPRVRSGRAVDPRRHELGTERDRRRAQRSPRVPHGGGQPLL